MRRTIVTRVGLDEPVIERLVAGTLAGEKRARDGLWLALWPVVEKIAGQWRVTSRLHDREDDRRDVAVRVMARLEAGDRGRLRTFHELLQRRNGSASEWFRVLAVRSALRYTEEHPEHLGAGERESRWADLVPLSGGPAEDVLPESVPLIPAIAAHEILAHAERMLPPPQLSALLLWAADQSDAQIAEELSLPNAAAAHKLVRAAHARLRTRFAAEQGDDARGEGSSNYFFGAP